MANTFEIPKFIRAKGLACACMVALWGSAFAQPPLRLTTVEGSHISTVGGKVLQAILPRAGLQVVTAPIPSARATAEVRAGNYDGEVARIATFAANYPELIRVEPSYLSFHTVAYAKNKAKLALRSADDLKGYKVGIVRGIQHSENATAGVADLTRVNNVRQLLTMLEKGRFDIAVDTRLSGEFMLKQLGFKDIAEVGVLGKQDLYLYLHVRHQSLAPAIGATIKQMKDSGELQRITQSVVVDF